MGVGGRRHVVAHVFAPERSSVDVLLHYANGTDFSSEDHFKSEIFIH